MSDALPANEVRIAPNPGAAPAFIVLIFTFLGPLFGLLSLFVSAAIRTLMQEPVSLEGLPSWPNALYGFVLMYAIGALLGGVQAILTGVVAAWSYIRFGRVSLVAVLIAAAACFSAFLVIAPALELMGANVWYMVLPHFAAAFCCWLIVARWRWRGAA